MVLARAHIASRSDTPCHNGMSEVTVIDLSSSWSCHAIVAMGWTSATVAIILISDPSLQACAPRLQDERERNSTYSLRSRTKFRSMPVSFITPAGRRQSPAELGTPGAQPASKSSLIWGGWVVGDPSCPAAHMQGRQRDVGWVGGRARGKGSSTCLAAKTPKAWVPPV